MTVGELIKELKQEPPDLMVVVRGYEAGYDDPEPRRVKLTVDSNWEKGEKGSWYFGRHGEENFWADERDSSATEALAL